MSLSLYDVTGHFESSVVIPSAESQSREDQKRLFKPGLHGCPYCQAHALSRLGENTKEIASWLFDASLRARLCSEKNERVTEALYKANFLSDGRLRRDLEVRFHSTSRPYGTHQTKRRANYRHLPGSGTQCFADDEHDVVLSLIRLHIESDLTKSLPTCRVEWLENKRLDPSRRRPDLQAKVYVESEFVDHLAIEVQKSRIGLETFKARHLVLSELATKAVWLFRESGLGGRFQPCIEWGLSNEVSMGSYSVTPSGALLISKILGLTDSKYEPSVPDLQDSRCNRSEYLDEKHRKQEAKTTVSLQSDVLGDLSFIYSPALRTYKPTMQDWEGQCSDTLELFNVQLFRQDSYQGIRPWEDH